MRVFITLPTAEIPSTGANQWLGHTIGRRSPHVVATSQPLPCWGEWVFVTDLQEEEIGLYEVKNPLGSNDRDLRYFIIPVTRVRHLKSVSFDSLTGRPWNQAVVTVMDRRTKRPQDRMVAWSLLWGSRRDIVDLKMLSTNADLVQVAVTLTAAFNHATDYLCVEQHTERPNPNVHSGVKESWWLEHLAGFAPLWATFPPAWKQWVMDPEVQRSADEYILEHIPEAKQAVKEARSFSSKENVIGGWHNVKEVVDRLLREELGPDVMIGKLASNSWTAVSAMPIRIAQRIGNYVDAQWEPPFPKPDYADPDASGRVLLANPTGSYPTYGPGVGEQMKDRYFLRQEGAVLKAQGTVERAPAKPLDFASPYRS